MECLISDKPQILKKMWTSVDTHTGILGGVFLGELVK